MDAMPSSAFPSHVDVEAAPPPRWKSELAKLGLAAVLLALDALLAHGVFDGLFYALIVVLTLRERGERTTYVAAAVASGCVVLGALLAPGAVGAWELVWRRGVSLGAVWGVAWLCLREKRIRAGRRSNAQTVERELAARTIAETRFGSVVEATPNGLVLTDAAGTIVLANAMTEEMFGYERGELIGRPVDCLVPERYRTSHPANRRAFLRHPESRAMGVGRDLRGVRKDGLEFPVEIGLSPIRIGDETQVLSAIVDITERVKANRSLELYAEELRRSNEELDSFAYVASHDLKAPLRAIGMLARWVEEDADGALPPASQEHLATLRQRVTRLERLLEDLLQYSRVGRVSAESERLDLPQVVAGVIEIVGLTQQFEVVVQPDLPTVRGHRAPLEQVFLNLIANAIKHHDRDSGRIEIGCRRRDGEVELWVEDDGPGIPKRFQERVFGMFQTLRPRDDVEGSGMGLAIIRKIVETYGGRIWIESPGDRGSRFVFTWPLEVREEVSA
jgi:PAS domain S-box-containing protein